VQVRILARIRNLLRRDAAGRRRAALAVLQRVAGALCFGALNSWRRFPVYVAFHPDSRFVFGAHPELAELRRGWLAGNRLNNGGDTARLYAFVLNVKRIEEEGIRGDYAELGVWKGNSSSVLAHYAALHGRRVFLFDTFEGFRGEDLAGIGDLEKRIAFQDTSLARVARTVGHPQVTTYVKGRFPDSITSDVRAAQFAFVSLDCDVYEPMKHGLDFFYGRMPAGGTIFAHDYSSGYWEGSRRAVDEFCARTGEHAVLLPDKSGTAVIRKTKG
jgi:hypothetical protein